jgi:hypothetical protein
MNCARRIRQLKKPFGTWRLKGVSPDYLHKSGYGLGFCPVGGQCGLKIEPDEQNEFKLE